MGDTGNTRQTKQTTEKPPKLLGKVRAAQKISSSAQKRRATQDRFQAIPKRTKQQAWAIPKKASGKPKKESRQHKRNLGSIKVI